MKVLIRPFKAIRVVYVSKPCNDTSFIGSDRFSLHDASNILIEDDLAFVVPENGPVDAQFCNTFFFNDIVSLHEKSFKCVCFDFLHQSKMRESFISLKDRDNILSKVIETSSFSLGLQNIILRMNLAFLHMICYFILILK